MQHSHEFEQLVVIKKEWATPADVVGMALASQNWGWDACSLPNCAVDGQQQQNRQAGASHTVSHDASCNGHGPTPVAVTLVLDETPHLNVMGKSAVVGLGWPAPALQAHHCNCCNASCCNHTHDEACHLASRPSCCTLW